MNRLSPELKRIMQWARQAQPHPLTGPPFGLSQRVVQAWLGAEATDPLTIWQQAVWKSAWPAAAVILIGLALLTAQRLSSRSPYDVSPAYEVVSTELVP